MRGEAVTLRMEIERALDGSVPPRLGQIVEAALDAVEPRRCTAHHLHLAGDWLYVGKRPYDLRRYDRIRVFGAGKAGLAMSRGILDRLGERVTDGLVVIKGETLASTRLGPLELRCAGHPLPDGRAVAATRDIIRALEGSSARDLVLAPISGGASALLCEPAIELDELRALVELGLRAGRSIDELNALRRPLDRIKAGGLARHAGDATVVGLILSDVIGDPLHLIGSGPTVPVDPSSMLEELARARSLLEQLEPSASRRDRIAAAFSLDPLPARPPRGEPVFNLVVGSNGLALEAAGRMSEQAGLAPAILSRGLEGEAREVGARLGELLAGAPEGWPFPRPAVLLAGGETTVTVTGQGRGGRNLELALAAVPALDGIPNVALLAVATDGDDGNSGAAGAVVTGATAARARAAGLSVDDAMSRNDAATFFERVGGLLRSGPTGTNVNDLVLLYAG